MTFCVQRLINKITLKMQSSIKHFFDHFRREDVKDHNHTQDQEERCGQGDKPQYPAQRRNGKDQRGRYHSQGGDQ